MQRRHLEDSLALERAAKPPEQSLLREDLRGRVPFLGQTGWG